MMAAIGLCQECRHFVPMERQPRLGECRRYAPRPAVKVLTGTQLPAAYWPIVLEEEFCGEFDRMQAPEGPA